MASEAVTMDNVEPPSVRVAGTDAPVPMIRKEGLKALGYNLSKVFMQYRADRRIQELRWLRNLRQYLGYYDPEVEKMFAPDRSRAYPKYTRVKCVSMLAHIMELMFPSDDRNWTMSARANPDMTRDDILEAIKDKLQRDQDAGIQATPDLDYVTEAIQELANKRAAGLTRVVDDQLQQLGGDQSYDYVALNTEVVNSGILYGLGALRGPFAREVKATVVEIDGGEPQVKTKTRYMPFFEWTPVWDFYPDMAAKRLDESDGYFLRCVMSRSQVYALTKRKDFFADVIKSYLKTHTIGNYRPEAFETELRAMGVKINVNEMKTETTKFEAIIWHGKVDGRYLEAAGVDVPEDKLADEIDAEVWLLDGYVIKADMNPWAKLGVDVKTMHTFLFDRDDTAPIGFGLPNVIRDTQMSISAATRMMLDNASVVCGPIVEMNTDLLRPDQDLTSLSAYKVFYREGDGVEAQWPAVRGVEIDSHIPELQSIIKLFMEIGDLETFSGPGQGGDLENMPSEPMRNAAGASMIFGKASLPFKQVIRNFDRFTESVIQSLVQFNRLFNPDLVPGGEYNVVARGATSLIAKEVRGMQIDAMAASLRPEDGVYIDRKKLLDARFKVRDLDDMLLSDSESARRISQQEQQQSQQTQQTQAWMEANIRKVLSDAFKNITQGQKNQAAADAQSVQAALGVLEQGVEDGQPAQPQRALPAPPGQAGGVDAANPGGAGGPAPPNDAGLDQLAAGAGQGPTGAGLV